MKPISGEVLGRFVKKAGDALPGDWVVIGGSVLPLVGIDERVTVDIDLAGPEESTQRDQLALMEIAAELGLAVEAINQAGAYFLHKIANWRKHIVLLHRGKRGAVFRPDLTLFLQLKCARLSETDLQDCLAFIRFARNAGEKVTPQLRARLEKQLTEAHGSRAERLKAIVNAIT